MYTGGAKSLGSDQFFNRDKVDGVEARNRLEKMKNSTSFSSDMFSGESNSSHAQTSSSRSDPSTEDLSKMAYDKLQHSVKDFFDDVRDRLA